ncbi:MAG TPA: hypothetical protein DEQ43_24890 [Nocardioides bacterium]|uniref:hypothetical protein n=1 Tax=uncultured Nocardioides sp. TaxID=198441 RepID=UPI000EC3E0DF|nr:hypothetical protein [uncultured Nocardioides sp.]HCB07448.1 hypothetical protein [Nocardioides sp.]
MTAQIPTEPHGLGVLPFPEGLLLQETERPEVAAYNDWVLDPSTADAAHVRAGLPAAQQPLVDIVAWTAGLTDALPAEPRPETAPEVAALAWAARAAQALDAGRAAEAVALLDRAADRAPAPLAAVLQGEAAGLRQDHGLGTAEEVGAALAGAEQALAGTDLAETRAGLLHRLGNLAHTRAATGAEDARTELQAAMRHYYAALQLVTEQSAPLLWAGLQLDLATAHLASPMTTASDQLRLGVATQALRASRRVFAEHGETGRWAVATVDLANALVYTPSTHQGDNLVEAVELYEEVLESGARDEDPLGRARLLANQGNTLAHLGAFAAARAKLAEARYLFEAELDHDGVLAVREVLDEIARAEVLAASEPEDGDLARQAEQMARVPQPEGYTSGMGVQVLPPPKPTVTVLPTRARTETPR